MSFLRPLAPYAAVALLIVVGSATALAYSLPRDSAIRAPSGTTSASAPLRADAQAVARQLGTPRFAYWRSDQDGRRRLWVSDAMGSRRWSIGTSAARDEMRQTRWSPNGAAVAYVLANTELVVTWLNGVSLRLPAWRDQGADEARRIIGYVWSADGRRIAATQRHGVGRTSPTDVFVADLGDPGRWIQVTAAGDVHVAEWAGPEELLVETSGGLVGLLRVGERDAIRPLTGMSAASPRILPDGRIIFGGGFVTDEIAFDKRYAVGSVWSTTPSGEMREESTRLVDQFRLEGRWPDGRFILSVPGGMKLSGSGTGNLPFLAGTIRRVAVSPDGSAAYATTDARILRLDIELAGSSPASADAASVVLDQAEEADVWFPRTPAVIGNPDAAFAAGPPTRYAFVMAGRIWVTDGDGNPRVVHAAHPSTTWFLRPRWSPDGERLLTAEIVRIGNEQRYVILMVDRGGSLTRLDPRFGATAAQSWLSSVAWSPAGDRIAIADGSIGAGWAEGEVRVLDLEGTEHGPRIPGRELVWTDGGLFVLGNGRIHEPLPGARVGHSIERVANGTRRTITDADRLARDPRSGLAAGVGVGMGQLAGSADGSYLSIQLYPVSPGGVGGRQQTVAIVRTADGAATSFLSFDPGRGSIGDLEWSPRGTLVGHTEGISSGSGPPAVWTSRAVVRDANGSVVAERDGRFAGWSPDGSGFYVSRPAGLYAYRVDGGAESRIGALGVSVVTTRP